MQLAVSNRPIPADLIGRKRFFDAGDPATASYAEERLDAIHSLLRSGKPNLFSWEVVGAAGGLTSKDLVCPSSLDFKPKGAGACFKIENTWGQVLSINRFGSELSDRCLADIIDLPIPLSISIHVQSLDKSKAVAFVKKRIAWMDKEIIDEQMSAVERRTGIMSPNTQNRPLC